MAKIIRLSKSVIGKEEKDAVMKVLDNEYLGMGKEVEVFENNLSNFFQREVICVSSGTAAIQLAIQACNIGKGDEILVPSLTYVATFQAIKATGATPIPCDIDNATCNIDINDASKRISSKTRAIIPVHYTGGVGDLNNLYLFAKKQKIRVIEDAAHAFGTVYNNKLIGSIGDIVCFSFDGIKNITSGEGGCIVSNDNKIIKRVKNSRLLGVENDSDKRYNNNRSWNFDVNNQGWRYHMSNIMAAIGIEQLKKREAFSKKRKHIAKYYNKLLKNNNNIILLERDYESVVPHIYVIKISNLFKRNDLKDSMLKKGVEIGIHYKPNHKLSYFKKKEINLPITEKIFEEIISLPMHPEISFKDVDYIVNTLNSLLPKFIK